MRAELAPTALPPQNRPCPTLSSLSTPVFFARSPNRKDVKRSVNGAPNKSVTKKDGAGGKGSWGKAGTEHEGVHDPINYDSGGAQCPLRQRAELCNKS